MSLTVTVFGHPAPQGSKRHVGNGVMVESSKAAKPWREAVKHAALDVMTEDGRCPYHDGDQPMLCTCPPATLDGPLAVSMVFTIRKPAGAPKRKRTWPHKKPDLSKLARCTEDALTDAGVIADDARIVQYDRLAKVFPDEGDDALPTPGAVIRVREVTS